MPFKDKEGNLWLYGGANNNLIKYYGDLWKYTMDHGCPPCATPYLKPTDINEISKVNKEYKIFPNPSSDYINVSISQFENLKIRNCAIQLHDFLGKQINTKVIQEETTSGGEINYQINIHELSSGIYFIRILDKENKVIANGKFIKE